MKLSKEFVNGVIIFIGIGLYFLLMTILGLANIATLRVFNAIFIFYGVNRTIQTNLAQGKTNFLNNAAAGMKTALVGVFLCIFGLLIFSYAQGGDTYITSNLSRTFLFGGNPSVNTYSICLLFEGIASSVIITFMIMLYWNSYYKTE
jgi:hypothetical protein